MQNIRELIRNISAGESAAHAYIIEGRPGQARDSFIRDISAGLECLSDGPDARPCGICSTCRQISAGTCMDIVRMDRSVGRTGNASYKTSDASAFIERLGMDPYGRFLIGIIDDADSMSETVQNKLLKTLEEPAPGTVLLLTAAGRDKLLETVRSRCSVIRLCDYDGYSEEDEEDAAEDIIKTAEMLLGRGCRFYEYRNAADKYIKSREDALMMLDALEDAASGIMKDSGTDSAGAAEMAFIIERAETARMDISRDMNYSRALKRLYLELR